MVDYLLAHAAFVRLKFFLFLCDHLRALAHPVFITVVQPVFFYEDVEIQILLADVLVAKVDSLRGVILHTHGLVDLKLVSHHALREISVREGAKVVCFSFRYQHQLF